MNISRRKYFRIICTYPLAEFLANTTQWNKEQLDKILQVAKQKATENGRLKIGIRDFQLALRKLREKGENV
jgi:hypothetical protein